MYRNPHRFWVEPGSRIHPGMAVFCKVSAPLSAPRRALRDIAVDLLDRYMNYWLVKALGLLSVILVAGAFYALASRMWYLAERSLRRDVVTEYLEIPTGYIVQYISVMSYVCAAMMISYGLYRVIKEK